MKRFIQSNAATIRRHAEQVAKLGAGKYLIDPQGQIIFVCAPNDNYTHDDWAWNNQGTGIEDLLDQGWVRVQNIFPKYLLVDAASGFSEKQNLALAAFIFDERLQERGFGRVFVEVGGVEKSDVFG